MNRTRARKIVAMAHVESVERAAEFYRHFGFEIDNTFAPPGSPHLSWAWLDSDGAQLMVARATVPVVSAVQGVLFYLYVDDVAATHRQLTAAGLAPGTIEDRFYAPQGEFRVVDPDGYVLMVTHV